MPMSPFQKGTISRIHRGAPNPEAFTQSRRFRSLTGLWLGTLAALLLVLTATPAPARATVMVEIPLEQLTDEADAIVLGSVVGTGTRLVLVDGIAEVHTVSRIRVERWLKGAGASTVLIDHIGGRIQNTMTWPTGTPAYGVGERVVVFLERAPEVPDGYRTAQLCQGKFAINEGIDGVSPTLVRRDTTGVSFARWAESGAITLQEGGLEPAMPLSDFIEFIERRLRPTVPAGGRTL